MKTWLALLLCAFTLMANAQGNPLYTQVASANFGRQIAADSAEAKQAGQYLASIAKAFNVPEENVAQSSVAALNVLRQKHKTAQLFDLFDAAQRIAPTEAKKDRSGMVHALTTYVGAFEPKAGAQAHEKAVKEVIELNKAAAGAK